MTLSRAYNSAKAVDPAKLLLLNKRRVKMPSLSGYDSPPPTYRKHNPTRTLSNVIRITSKI